MATCGTPSGSPVWPIGWQITRRQPSKLGCLRVATTLPSTRARSTREWSDGVVERWGGRGQYSGTPTLQHSVDGWRSRRLVDSEIVHHHASAHAAERFRVRDAFAGGGRDRVTQIAFAAQ